MILSTSDVNHSWLVFKHTFLKIMHLTIPSKIASPTPHPPWISRSLLSSFRRRNLLYKRAKLTNSVQDWSLYRSFRNSTLALLRSLKSKFFRSLSSSPSPRHFWSSVKKLRKKVTSVPPLLHNNHFIHSDSSKASLLNNFFSSCFNSSTPSLSSLPSHPSPPSTPCPPDLLCSENEILHLLLNLSSNSATGPDGISARMLKLSASSIAAPLTNIFNLSISSGIFPSDWKNSNVVPIPKTKSPSSSPSDYRPISLLPIISKVLERHIFNYLHNFCSDNQTLSDSQFGFRPGRSTESALLSVTHSWLSSLDSHNSLCAVFFDLRKAFDSVPHQPLMHTLSSIGLSSHLTSWFFSYLCNRSQQVVLNGSSSHKSHAFSGVPQGSILGPLLFIIYLNSLSDIPLSPSSKLTFYADDILFSHQCNSASDIPLIQSDINSIASWISAHYLTINTSKTKYMFISFKSAAFFSTFPSLYLNGSLLDRVSSFKYLGILISSNLSWTPHLLSISRKSRQLIGILYRLFYRHSDPSSLFKLYSTLIRPHLEYCSSVWDPSSSATVSQLEKIQFFALKLCSKNWSSDYSSLLHLFNCPSLSSRREKSKLISLFKILNGYMFFLPNSFHPLLPSSMLTRSFHPRNLFVPRCRTSAFLSSFVPNSCSLWNSLPSHLKDCGSLASFKYYICNLQL